MSPKNEAPKNEAQKTKPPKTRVFIVDYIEACASIKKGQNIH